MPTKHRPGCVRPSSTERGKDVLSIAAMGSGQGRYYLSLAREDYYLEGGERPGYWWGSGADRLGLTGTVKPDDLRALLAGFLPSGQALVQNAGAENRQPGWDLTVSPPKPFSVLWSQADGDRRRALETAHQSAVHAALTYVQETLAYSRIGKAGTGRVQSGLLLACFEHSTNREQDPQLHTHCLLLNIAVRPDGTTGTVLSKPFYQHKKTIGAIYRAELGFQLQKLGYFVVQDNGKFLITGVPQKLAEHFSKRRAAIEARLAARGEDSPQAAAIAALDTRVAKGRVPPRSELFARWRQDAASLGFTTIPALAPKLAERLSGGADSLPRLLDQALKQLSDGSSTFTRHRFVRTVAEASVGHGVSSREIRSGVERTLRSSPRIFELVRSGRLYGIRQAFRTDKQLFDEARKLRSTGQHGVTGSIIADTLRRHASPRSAIAEAVSHHVRQLVRAARREKTIAPTQSAALSRRVLTESERRTIREMLRAQPGGLRLVRCAHGRGRDHVLRAAREALERSGYRVLLASPSKDGARRLARITGADSITHRALEFHAAPTPGDRVLQSTRAVIRAATRKPNASRPKIEIAPRTAILIEGSERIRTDRFKRFLKAARDNGALLILVGDAGARARIKRQGPFGSLLQQREERRRRGMKASQSPEQQRVIRTAVKGGRQRETRLVRDWLADSARHRGEAVVLCRDAIETARMNRLCQEERVRTGEIRGKCLVRDGVRFFEGDRVRFDADSKLFGARCGETGTLLKAQPKTQTVLVRLDSGARLNISIRDCRELCHGYAVTAGARHDPEFVRVYTLHSSLSPRREAWQSTKVEIHAYTSTNARHREEITSSIDQVRAAERASLMPEHRPDVRRF